MNKLLGGSSVLHRYACSALDELRAAAEKINLLTYPISKRHILSLTEELQTAVNRMENALAMRREVEFYEQRYGELKKEIRQLREERQKLEEESE